jgi:hypothetical protein
MKRHMMPVGRQFSLWAFLGLVAGASACTSNDDAGKSGAVGGSGGSSSAGKGSGGATGGSSGKGTGGTGGNGGATGGSSGKGTGGTGGNGGNGGSTAGSGGSGNEGGDDPGTGGTGGNTGGSAGKGGKGGGAGTNSTGGTAGMGGAPADGPIKVVIIGSSTPAGKNLDNATYGGTTLADSWPNRYAAYLPTVRAGSTVVNLAVSGIGTWEGLPTGSTAHTGPGAPAPNAGCSTPCNITAALAQNPDAIIVNFPSGDVVDDWTVDQVIANLHTIEDAATQAGVPIWIATSQPAGGITSQQITLLEDQRTRTLADFGEHALDFWTPLAANDGTQKPELSLTDAAVHPNAEGHRLLFEVVKNEDIPGQL